MFPSKSSSEPDEADLFRVGLIVKIRGVRGEVAVKPLTDDPQRFRLLDEVYVESAGHRRVEAVRFHGGRLTVKFWGCDDADAALALKGCYISIPRDQLVPLKADHYFIFDLLDCAVEDLNGVFLGVLTDVLETGSNDVYVVRHPTSGAERLIPALKTVVRDVRIPEKRIVVDAAEGTAE